MPEKPPRSACAQNSQLKDEEDQKVSQVFAQYQDRCKEVISLQEDLEQKRQELLLKGDIGKRCPMEKISPYRVYKRESAPHIKAEYPNMSNEERA